MRFRFLRRALLAAALAGAAIASFAQGAAAPRVVLATSAGDITIELNRDKAPKTVDNFISYVKAGHYDGTIFHRVIDGFMIQGGGFTPDFTQKATRAPIALESQNGLNNDRGTVAMARTGDPNSATAQFFINLADNEFLNYRKFDKDTEVPGKGGSRTVPAGTVRDGYAVFGKVVAGMDVVDKIRGVPTGSNGPHQNVPTQPVVIKSARLLP
jgi:peptidyl-prolyl cis-trans isomerase A (cyclophilin A)